jgi:glycosyltransferase involved in cell wall biosynthesis
LKKPVALVLGPGRQAMSGVTTHVNLLLGSPLASLFALAHFQVGSEGRNEGILGKAVRFVFSPLQLIKAILQLDASLLHVNTSMNARAYWRDLAYVAIAKLLGTPVVYQVHGGSLPLDFMKPRFARAFLRWTLRWPDVVVVLARAELEAYRHFVPEQTIALLPNGIDCGAYLRYSRPAVDPQAPLRLAYIGRVAPAKGLGETIEALHMLQKRGIRTRFMIGGSGPEESVLRLRIKELQLEGVEFLGPVHGDEKARLLSQTDVLLLPSYSEGLPYALLEGMAAGAVPVATPVGAIPDVVIDGLHGTLVPPRDAGAIASALARLAGDRSSLTRMSAACRKRIASGYSIDRLAAELGELYQELVPCAASQAG